MQQSTAIVSLAKPGETGEATAEEMTTVRKQSRTRTRKLDDGTVVVEEQETVFCERVVVWSPSVRESSGSQAESQPPVAATVDSSACVD